MAIHPSLLVNIPSISALSLTVILISSCAVTDSQDLSPEVECEASESVTDAIYDAQIASNNAGRPKEVQDLINEALLAASSPDCDNIRASNLANKARLLADSLLTNKDMDEPAKQISMPTENRDSVEYWDCEELIDEGTEALEAPMVSLFTSTFGPFATSTCITGQVSTGLSNLSKEMLSELQRKRYVDATYDMLARDLSRGFGDYMISMAYLEGCPKDAHEIFADLAQESFSLIFRSPKVDAEDVLSSIEVIIAANPLLASKCNRS